MKRFFLLLVVHLMVASVVLANNDKLITTEQLPAKAKQFIETYFPEAKVSYAKKESEIFEKSFEVIFADGHKVEFDGNGEWKDVDCKFTQVPEGIVPVQITNYVNANYKEMKIIEIDRDKRDYEVKLSNGLELKFDLNFNLIDVDN